MMDERYFTNTPDNGICFAFCDGAGPRVREARKCMGTGVVLIDQGGSVFYESSYLHFSEHSTNILAEMLALEDTLRAIEAYGIKDAGWVIFNDNEYVVDAACGYTPVRKPHLVPVMERVHAAIIRLRGLVVVKWMSRDENNLADKLSKSGFASFGLDFT